ncbi:MAG: hypothetical protein ABIF10_04290 [Candidatus Woesearchaeota archaeon]
MVTTGNVERNSIISFNRLKLDIRTIAKWIGWNKKEHEMLKARISAIEAQLKELTGVKYIGSVKTNRVHSSKCMHAKRIKEENRQYFDELKDARLTGYKACECAA